LRERAAVEALLTDALDLLFDRAGRQAAVRTTARERLDSLLRQHQLEPTDSPRLHILSAIQAARESSSPPPSMPITLRPAGAPAAPPWATRRLSLHLEEEARSRQRAGAPAAALPALQECVSLPAKPPLEPRGYQPARELARPRRELALVQLELHQQREARA